MVSIALLSWLDNVVGSIAVLILLAAWLSDLRSSAITNEKSSESLFLSASFLDNGFCLSPLFDNTHLVCASFDLMCGVAFLAAGLLFNKKTSGGVQEQSSSYITSPLFGIAAYVLSHSYGHYVAGTELKDSIEVDRGLPTGDFITLAMILSIGPMRGAEVLVEAKKVSRRVGNILAGLVLCILVAIYGFYIRYPKFALLYINITILMTSAVPAALTIGFQSDKDIAIRTSNFTWFKFLSSLFVSLVVFCEPFYCDSIVAGIGGHLIFDMSLVVYAIAEVCGGKEEISDVSEKEKLKSL